MVAKELQYLDSLNLSCLWITVLPWELFLCKHAVYSTHFPPSFCNYVLEVRGPNKS